jgi:hypothetical protein
VDELRTSLRNKAEEMRLDPEMPPGLRKRARRRRAGNALLASVLALSIGTAAFAGARLLVAHRPEPRPAGPPAGQTLPIWPSVGADADVAYIDGIQQQVDSGHQPAYLSPQLVAEMFAMEVMGWKQADIVATVLGEEPVQVVISNPQLGVASDTPNDVRTVLTLARWRGREDGVFVVARAESAALDLRSPTPAMVIADAQTLTFTGKVRVFGPGGENLTRVAVNIEGSYSFASGPITDAEQPTIEDLDDRDSPVAPSPDGDFELTVAMPEEYPSAPGVSVFVQRSGGGNLAVEAFRLGPAQKLPPLTTQTEALPADVVATRDAILLAASERSWAGLEALITPAKFEFSFGGDRDPVRFWRQLEQEGTPVREILAILLSYPAVEYPGMYMWPSAATKAPNEWSEADLEPLRRIYSGKELEEIKSNDMYYDWRVGIDQDGKWIFFVTGD